MMVDRVLLPTGQLQGVGFVSHTSTMVIRYVVRRYGDGRLRLKFFMKENCPRLPPCYALMRFLNTQVRCIASVERVALDRLLVSHHPKGNCGSP